MNTVRTERLLVRRRLTSFLFGVHQAKLLQLVAQRIAADVEQFGGLRLVAVGLLHGHFNQAVLDLLQSWCHPRESKAGAGFCR